MALLEGGRPAADRWVSLADEDALPQGQPAIVSLARLAGGVAHDAPLGVRVGPATRAEELAALLPRLALIAVEFPKFRDGRGFSLARTLRERHEYRGEIRAVGHVLPDQHRFLLRCGFSSVLVPEGADLAPWTAALGRFHFAYQPAVAEEPPLNRLRRRLAPAPP